jgi:hypothetical protein
MTPLWLGIVLTVLLLFVLIDTVRRVRACNKKGHIWDYDREGNVVCKRCSWKALMR